MRPILLCLLGIILAVGADAVGVNPHDIPDFSSKFLIEGNTKSFLDLMKTHFANSLDYLYSGKYYESQKIEYPGMAKLLVDESDRQWEEGMNVLKKYLHLGGTTEGNNFINSMDFTKSIESHDAAEVEYKNSLKTVMEKSQALIKEITKLHVSANKVPSKNGDVSLSHFLEEKAEKESDVARKMAGLYIMLRKMVSNGIAIGIFDQSL
uniref:Uncharacterized protein n=1 Tax=Scylla olivacea TaxID=85551 RepID=A0A0P4W197_SCYOL